MWAPTRLWAEAVYTANRIRNLLPNLKRTQTPYELFHQHKPDLSRLRIFGCTAHVHVPKEKGKKLDARSETGMLVGYSSKAKAWRIAFQERGSISIVERDSVVFDETKLGQLPSCKPPSAERAASDAVRPVSTYEPTSRVESATADDVSIDLDTMRENTINAVPNQNAPIAPVVHVDNPTDEDQFQLPIPEVNDDELFEFLQPQAGELAKRGRMEIRNLLKMKFLQFPHKRQRQHQHLLRNKHLNPDDQTECGPFHKGLTQPSTHWAFLFKQNSLMIHKVSPKCNNAQTGHPGKLQWIHS